MPSCVLDKLGHATGKKSLPDTGPLWYFHLKREFLQKAFSSATDRFVTAVTNDCSLLPQTRGSQLFIIHHSQLCFLFSVPQLLTARKSVSVSVCITFSFRLVHSYGKLLMWNSFSQFAIQILLTAFHCKSSVLKMPSIYWRKLLVSVSTVYFVVLILLVSFIIVANNFLKNKNDGRNLCDLCTIVPH